MCTYILASRMIFVYVIMFIITIVRELYKLFRNVFHKIMCGQNRNHRLHLEILCTENMQNTQIQFINMIIDQSLFKHKRFNNFVVDRWWDTVLMIQIILCEYTM